jgi:hypothetical protein
MDLSVHIILSEDASSLLQATYPSSHLNCSALGPLFERFFNFRRAQRDSAEKTSEIGLNDSGRYRIEIEVSYFACPLVNHELLLV